MPGSRVTCPPSPLHLGFHGSVCVRQSIAPCVVLPAVLGTLPLHIGSRGANVALEEQPLPTLCAGRSLSAHCWLITRRRIGVDAGGASCRSLLT